MSTSHVKVMVPPAVVAPRAAQLAAMLATPLFLALAWIGRAVWVRPGQASAPPKKASVRRG